MEKKLFLIAKGNPTLLIWNCLKSNQKSVIQTYLDQVDQIGFVSQVDRVPNFTMMGNELCINATLAFASTLRKQGKLLLNGNLPIKYENTGSLTEISLELPYKLEKNIILFDGIGFIFEQENAVNKDVILKDLADIYILPAFGFIVYKDNKISPYIYVKQTNSLKKESACGSGSIAFSLFSNIQDVIQPTEEVISIRQNQNKFFIKANVEKYPYENGGETYDR